jgi:hypothetical protein
VNLTVNGTELGKDSLRVGAFNCTDLDDSCSISSIELANCTDLDEDFW